MRTIELYALEGAMPSSLAITADVLPADKSASLVFYCWSPECPAAGMAAETAASLGFTNVSCMYAGITGWQDAGLATEP